MAARPEEIEAALKTIDRMYASGALPDDSYYKCIVTLASECLVNQSDQEQALMLLNRCPPSYYGQVLPDQLREDEMFATVVLELSYKIIQHGILSEDLHQPTMPSAKA